MFTRVAAGDERLRLGRGILFTALGLLLARSFGLVRELVVSARFGPSTSTDATYAALTILTTAMTVFAMSMPVAVTRTLYAPTAVHDRRRAVWQFLFAWAVLLLVLSATAFVFVGPLARAVVDSRSASFLDEVGRALRLAIPTLALQGMSSPLIAIAYAEGCHKAAAATASTFPVGTALGALLWGPKLGPSSILVGAALTSLTQTGFLLVVVARSGLGAVRPILPVPFDLLGRAVANVGPMVVGVVLLKLDMPLLFRFATHLAPGDAFLLSVSIMVLGAPMSIVVNAINQPAIPALVRVSGDRARFSELLHTTLELAMCVAVPVSVLFAVDSETIVEILLHRGRFGEDAVLRSSAIVMVWGGSSWMFLQTLYGEDILGSLGHMRGVAVGRALFVPVLVGGLVLGLRYGGRAPCGALTGMIVGFVIASIARWAGVMEALARRTGVGRAALLLPTLKLLLGSCVGAYLGTLATRPFPHDTVGSFARVAIDASAIGLGVVVSGLALGINTITKGLALASRWLGRRSAPRG